MSVPMRLFCAVVKRTESFPRTILNTPTTAQKYPFVLELLHKTLVGGGDVTNHVCMYGIVLCGQLAY